MIMTSIKYFSVVGPGGGDWNGICGTVGGELGNLCQAPNTGQLEAVTRRGSSDAK